MTNLEKFNAAAYDAVALGSFTKVNGTDNECVYVEGETYKYVKPCGEYIVFDGKMFGCKFKEDEFISEFNEL